MALEERMSLFPTLADHARLVAMRDCSAAVNRLSGQYVVLSPVAGAVLAMCNGSISLERIVRICSESLPRSLGVDQHYVAQALEKCEAYLVWNPTPRETDWKYHPPDFLSEPRPKAGYRNLPLEKPLVMTLVLTNRCNQRCVYCFRAAGPKWQGEFSRDEVFAVIEQAAEMGLKHCSLTGGEPTLHADFVDIVVRMLERDIYPYVSTNGTCVSEADLSELRAAGLETIQFSLDAGTRELYERMVGVGGHFDRVLDAIAAAKRLGFTVRVKGVVTALNSQGIGDLFAVCAERGVDYVFVEAFSPGLRGRGSRELLVPHEVAVEVQSAVEQARERFSSRMTIPPFTVPGKWAGPDNIIYCGGMYSSFIVQPDGTVCACEQVCEPALCFGNVREHPLAELWGSERVLRFLNPDLSNVPEPCRSCEQLSHCRTGCFNYSLQYSDELYSPDPRCWKVDLGQDNPLLLDEQPAATPPVARTSAPSALRARPCGQVETWNTRPVAGSP